MDVDTFYSRLGNLHGSSLNSMLDLVYSLKDASIEEFDSILREPQFQQGLASTFFDLDHQEINTFFQDNASKISIDRLQSLQFESSKQDWALNDGESAFPQDSFQQLNHEYDQKEDSNSRNVDSNGPQTFTVFVGDLTHDIDEQDLNEAFSQFGEIHSVSIVKDKNTGESKLYGFVNFTSMESMKKAVQQAKRIQVKNATISTQISSQRFVLWVSPINPSTSDEELEHFVMDKTGVQPLSVRIRKSFAFVYFTQKEDADVVLSKLNGQLFDGSPLTVEVSGKNRERKSTSSSYPDLMGYQGMVHIPPTRALYIGNIADSVDDEILRQHFSQIGPVIRAVVKKDVSSKRHLGYGFIEYQDDRYIDIALRQLQNSNLEGSSLRIEISKTKAHSSRAYRSNGRNPQEMPVPPHRFVRYPLAFDASANSSDYSRTPYDYYAGYGAPVDPYYAMYMPHPGMHVPFDPYAYGQLPPYPQQGVPPGAGKSNQKSSGKGYGRSSGSSKGARYSPY